MLLLVHVVVYLCGMFPQIKIQTGALAIGLVLMAVKVLAWWLTKSDAILTDALESIVNIVAGAFGLYSLVLASKPRDLDHPYGHGKIEFVAAGLEGGLIFFAGTVILWKSAYGFLYPHPLASLGWGLWLTGLTGGINYLIGWRMSRYGRQHDSMVLISGGSHLKSDAYSSVGILAGLGLLLLTGWQWVDSATAMIFGFVILYHGWQIIRESMAGIMDEADQELITSLALHLELHRQNEWIDVHNLRIIKYGNTFHIDCHLTLPWYLNLQDAHAAVKTFEKTADSFATKPVELFVHSDPCEAHSCEICQISDCPVRQRVALARTTWTPENIIANRMHSVS